MRCRSRVGKFAGIVAAEIAKGKKKCASAFSYRRFALQSG
jgi:hypothetical protein